MSHEVIIIDHPDEPGLAATHSGGSVRSEVRFAPPHDMPQQVVLKRLLKAQKSLEKIREMLLAPADAPDED